MLRTLRRLILAVLGRVPGEPVSHALAPWFGRKLVRLAEEIKREAPAELGKFLEDRGVDPDKLLEFLLGAMDAAFWLSRSYRENIKGFRACYVFASRDGEVGATASFADGNMKVYDEAQPCATARVIFHDAKALWNVLFGRDQQILDLILDNAVEVQGNLNYLYKFGFLVRDLERRLGIA